MRMHRALLAFCLLLFASAALAQNFPKLSGRVVDAANLLSPQQETALDTRLAALEQASSRQLVVATIPSLEGYEIEDYGYRLGRAWGIGQSEANNGTILIVAPNEKKVRIEVGYGLEPILTDGYSSLIIQNAILPRFKQGDMAGGIIAGTDEIIKQLQAPPEQAEQRAQAANAKQPQRSSGGQSIFPLFFWGVIILFVLLPMLGRGSRARGRRYRGGGSAWPIVLWTIANEMDRGRRGGWGGGSGGGFGGWGGGGGGGGFSGGGGSFGGGGASGSW